MKKRRVDVGFPRVGWYQSSAYLLLTFTLCICALTAFLSGFQLSTANGGACENIRPGRGRSNSLVWCLAAVAAMQQRQYL